MVHVATRPNSSKFCTTRAIFNLTSPLGGFLLFPIRTCTDIENLIGTAFLYTMCECDGYGFEKCTQAKNFYPKSHAGLLLPRMPRLSLFEEESEYRYSNFFADQPARCLNGYFRDTTRGFWPRDFAIRLPPGRVCEAWHRRNSCVK